MSLVVLSVSGELGVSLVVFNVSGDELGVSLIVSAVSGEELGVQSGCVAQKIR